MKWVGKRMISGGFPYLDSLPRGTPENEESPTM